MAQDIDDISNVSDVASAQSSALLGQELDCLVREVGNVKRNPEKRKNIIPDGFLSIHFLLIAPARLLGLFRFPYAGPSFSVGGLHDFPRVGIEPS